ncbi:hypothetical protein B0F90DRAFT_899334 [Multifurca ochricompacta]|uniref:F-box domain-containing protein n=1 Tax=Multifurca ochricompacta TaxID=376703 RepID=A0AAD4LW52_9AGAM|nr:hypothetical protein B0F90DRAFT_899334 [Multifurca ochricompacta]
MLSMSFYRCAGEFTNSTAHSSTGRLSGDQTGIDTLPDNVLLDIFDFSRLITCQGRYWKWHKLVLVCRRWRELIFESPRRLQLELVCKPGTPVRRTLGCWRPNLPLVITFYRFDDLPGALDDDEDDIIAALEQRDRVREIYIDATNSLLGKLVKAMEEPFVALRSLWLSSKQHGGAAVAPILSDGFLGGSAPSLVDFSLEGIPFPALPKLLLSTSTRNLSYLRLEDIPPIIGYIPPEEMAIGLSALTNLQTLQIQFQSPTTTSSRRLLPPPTTIRRINLPSLFSFIFRGTTDYLEDLLVRIDAPVLGDFNITFFNQLFLNTPQLSQFISRTEALNSFNRASFYYDYPNPHLLLYNKPMNGDDDGDDDDKNRSLSLKIYASH